MKPFNLEQALAGAPLVTRDGEMNVSDFAIRCDIRGDSETYICAATVNGLYRTYTEKGEFLSGVANLCDLFMAEVEEKPAPTKKPHKHAELIKAWADGADIEICALDGRWVFCENPTWENTNYRIKPEPKPDVIRYAVFRENSLLGSVFLIVKDLSEESSVFPSIKLFVDGETGEPKAVELIKGAA
jgi:hypothetical protein